MTTEAAGAMVDASASMDDDRLFCYRHPKRETHVRCGRCERPICMQCAMQGPVGFRCRQCGTLAFDPMRSVSGTQAVIGLAIAVGLGAIAGFIASRIGFFAIFVSFFAGGLIAEAVTRVIGYKRGPTILLIVLGGIVCGTLIGSGLTNLFLWMELSSIPVPAGLEFPVGSFLLDALTWTAVSAGAACFGAYSRLR